ncbi:MAG: hypothetical protein FWC43_04065 [Planctomycetaceae bacterium]|nr:hypothetical protein [Planctomycetaceae bacterium]
MTRISDFFYAGVPSFCFALPFALMPDLQFVQGIEKLGIVGILTLGMMLFLWERRYFMARTDRELLSMDKHLEILEKTFTSGHDKVIRLLGEQLDALKEIKTGQTENFSRMWQLTLDRFQPSNDNRQLTTDGKNTDVCRLPTDD